MDILPPHIDNEGKSTVASQMGKMEQDIHTVHITALQTYAHLMLEHVPVAMALFETSEFRLLAANSRYHALNGPVWQHGYALGQTLTAILAEVLPGEQLAHIIDHFSAVVQTGKPFRVKAYQVVGPTRGETYWDWTAERISDQDHVRYLLVTVTDVTASVKERQQIEQAHTALTQLHRSVESERQRLAHGETILMSLQNITEPKRLAASVLAAIDACFSPSLQAFYSIQVESGSFSLLSWHKYLDGLQTDSIVTPPSHLQSSDLLPLEAMPQTPLVKRKSQGDEDLFLAQSDSACVAYFPLWGKRCEGILVLVFAREEELTDLLMKTLKECTPHIVEALVSARLHLALAEERQRLYTILDQLPEGVLLVNARTSNISYANPAAARLLGVSLSQLVGVPLNQSTSLSPCGRSQQSQQPASRWNFALIHALWGKISTNQELLISRPDSSEVVVLSSAAPIRGSNGLISEAVIVFQDITLLKRLEQEKNEFFAVANHELRTPLTIISGFADLLLQQDNVNLNTLHRYALTSITQESEHLTHLLHGFLDVSRLEFSHLDLHRSAQDLLGLLQQSVTKYAHAISTHHISLKLEDLQPDELLVAWFDRSRIEQVLNNLLSNAIKYSPAASEIEVGVRPHRDPNGSPREALIWVKDQGRGIAQSDLPHIFERFYRANPGETSIRGFGIGLYLTKEIVHGHEGHIWVESEPDLGSTFFVSLLLGAPTVSITP